MTHSSHIKDDFFLSRRTARIWLAVIFLFFLGLYLVKAILLPFVVGILTAYFLDPAADRLEKWGLSRLSATATITIIFFSTAALIFILLIPVLAEQLSGLLADLPGYIKQLETLIEGNIYKLNGTLDSQQVESARAALTNISGAVITYLGNLLSGMLASGMAVINLLSLVFITPVVAFYLLRDWDRIVDRVDALLPREHVEVIREQMRKIDKTLSGFIRGQTNVCLFLGVYYAIGLSLVGMKFSIVIGLMTGVLAVIPYIGVLTGFALSLAVAYFQFEAQLMPLIWVVVVFVTGQILEGGFITPKLVGDKVGLHPLWIIFGLLAGGTLFGFVGVLIAVPVTAIIGVLVRFAMGRYLESNLYYGDKKTPTPALLPPPAAPTQGA